MRHLNGTLTDTIIPDKSGNNSNEGVTLHSPDLQNWNLNIRYSLVAHRVHPFFGGGTVFSVYYSQYILKSTDRVDDGFWNKLLDIKKIVD